MLALPTKFPAVSLDPAATTLVALVVVRIVDAGPPTLPPPPLPPTLLAYFVTASFAFCPTVVAC